MASQNDIMEIEKLKVADLKKELKARGLSTIGIKSELIERLQDALSTSSTENADDDVNEDEVLGDDELLSETEKSAELLISEDVILSPEQKPKLVIVEKIEKENTRQSVNVTKPPSPPAEADKLTEKPVAVSMTADKILSSQERLTIRAKRFSTTTTEDARKKARAERFGLAAKSGSNAKITGPAVNSTEKMKQRASRFGVAVSESMKKLDDSDRLKKRKERFGAVLGGTKVTVDIEEKKKKRAERFGIK